MGGDGEDNDKRSLHGQGRRCLPCRRSIIEGEDLGGFPLPSSLAVGVGMGMEIGVEEKEKENEKRGDDTNTDVDILDSNLLGCIWDYS